MGPDTERLQILGMVEKGQITAQEGARLLEALAGIAAQESPVTGKPSWFRVRVTDTRNGRRIVDVSIPLSLVSVGLRLGARFVPDDADVDVAAVLRQIDEEGLQGKVVDVTDDTASERVEIYVE